MRRLSGSAPGPGGTDRADVEAEREATLAVSGLGVPEPGLVTFLDLVESLGVRGVEIRHGAVLAGECDDATIRSRLEALEFVTLASRVKVGEGTPEEFIESMSAAVVDATRLGASHVRVFPGAGSGAGRTADVELIDRLVRASQLGREAGVHVALETHDSHSAAGAVSALLEAAVAAGAEAGSLGAIWDVLHTWRAGESPAESLAHLTDWLPTGWIQVKDAVSRTDPVPELPGEGKVPLIETLAALREHGYTGWLSLEWERVWFPQIPPLEVALAHLRSVMDDAMAGACNSCTHRPPE